jgi:hypothetical protein
MKPVKLFLIALILMIGAMKLAASGNVAIYAIVEKVVLEPNDNAPERVQIWGAFTLADGGTNSSVTLTPQRGYLYFSLPPTSAPEQRGNALKEWADFKRVAGSGQAVAFGHFAYIGAFSDELMSRPAGMRRAQNVVRAESVAPSSPDPYMYPLGVGLIRLPNTGNLAAVVEKLKAALKR